MFTLTAKHLQTLIEKNGFPVPKVGIVFLGLRGCLPADAKDFTFADKHRLATAELNYHNPRCTLVQYLPEKGRFAAYPGSTVPTDKYIEAARRRGGQGANQLCTGYYDDYRKGWHKAGSPTGHAAFRQTASRPIQRTADDTDYDPKDPADLENPADNLHAAWCSTLDGVYSSAGCQVVVGLPKCEARGDAAATGAWAAFVRVAYAAAQSSFPYALVKGAEAAAQAVYGNLPAKVRFGSEGENARRVQQALKQKGFYEGVVDGRFGFRSMRALLAFQRRELGVMAADGICGQQTATALGITLV